MMRSTSPSRECRGFVRGRRILAANKQKKSSTSTKTVKPKPVLLESHDLDISFQTCAYPSAVEIFKLSQQLELPPSKIKEEFQKRRQVYRQRNKLSDDTIIYSRTLPWTFILLQIACTKFNCSKQSLAQIAIFLSSIFSLWYSVYNEIGNYNYNQELVYLV